MPRSTDTPPDPTRLPDGGAAELSRLLGGLDQLARILDLPDGPGPDGDVPLGRYRLRRRVGEGRFGIVLLADDPRLGRSVVVKVPQPAVLADPEILARFVREARAAARLDHPGVIPVFEAGEDRGLAFLVAGYVDGPTLEEWLRSRTDPLDPRTAAELVARLAEAVRHAHERGVLHCDLKPANVLLDRPGPGEEGVPGAGVPRVTDFGLARLLEDDPALTHTFQIAGTPLYMAPEQARGDRRNLTARSDVYSLGAILYELLTGRPAFAAESADRVLLQVIHVRPWSPRRANPSVPRDLEAICLRCLEKDPANRYPTADALADDLRRFLAGRPTAARSVGAVGLAWRAVRRRPVVATLTAVAAAAVCAVPAVAVGYSFRLEKEALARRQAERNADRDRELADTGEFFAALEQVRQRRAAWPPGWVAANTADVARLAGMRPAAGEAAALRTEAAAALAGFDLPEPRTVAGGFKAHVSAFSADGKLLALGGWHSFDGDTWEVRVVDPGTGAVARRLTHPIDRPWGQRRGVPDADGVRAVAFSPDGRWLVAGTRSGWLVRWDWQDPSRPPIAWRHAPPLPVTGDDRVIGLAFTERGRVLASAGGRDLVAWDIRQGWAEVGRKTDAQSSHFAELARPARVGDPLYGKAGAQTIRVTDSLPVLHPTGHDISVQAGGPGGQYVVGPGSGSGDQFRMVDAGTWSAIGSLTLPDGERSEDGPITDAVVSPDGLFLVTTAEHVGHLKVWDLLAGRVVAARTLGDQGEGSLRASFSPDGRTLAVCEIEKTLLYDLSQPRVVEPIAVQRLPVRDADQSADGSAVATYASDLAHLIELVTWETGRPDLDRSAPSLSPGLNNRCVVALDPTRRRVIASGGGGIADWTRPEQDRMSEFPLRPKGLRNLKDLRFDPAGGLWACVSGGLARWPGGGGPPVVVLAPEPDVGNRHPLCVAPGRTAAVVGRADGTVARHPLGGGPADTVWPVFEDAVSGVALAPDELTAVAGTSAGDVAVVRVSTGEPVVRLPGVHQDTVRAAAIGPGGWFATGSADRTVKVWSPAGRPVLTLFQTRPVRRLFWSADGRTLTVLAEGERGLRRWRLDQLRAELAALGLDPGLP